MNPETWKLAWPNHCTACGGWGGKVFYETHGFAGGGAEQMFDPCPECSDAEHPKCGRCGHGFTEEWVENPVPCKACGWNHDDGIPEI
jgi:hypothetical protein